MSKPFVPNDASTVTISATATNATTALVNPGKGPYQVRLYNSGFKTVFIRFGTSNAVTAALTDIPVPPGALEIITLEGGVPASPITHVAAICAATEVTTLYVTTGFGI